MIVFKGSSKSSRGGGGGAAVRHHRRPPVVVSDRIVAEAPTEHVRVETGQIRAMASSAAALHQHAGVSPTSSRTKSSLFSHKVSGIINFSETFDFSYLDFLRPHSDLLTDGIQNKKKIEAQPAVAVAV